jgi:hypothetical protein
MNQASEEIAAAAARWVVEEGLSFGAAKLKAVKSLGLNGRAPMPSNDQVEDEVLAYLELFCADTHPFELMALRAEAMKWMMRLSHFNPYLAGSVWRGSANKLSDIYLQLFCEDPKSLEIELINRKVDYDARSIKGFKGESVDALSINVFIQELETYVGLHLMVYDYDDLRGALKPDSKGRSERGNLASLQNLLSSS